MEFNLGNIKRKIFEDINRRTEIKTIRINSFDSFWNDNGQKCFEEHKISKGDCQKCAADIAKNVYFELLKQGYRK